MRISDWSSDVCSSDLLEWDFDDSSVLQDFTAGVRYTDRSAINRSTPYNWQFLSAPWAGNSLPLTNYAISNPFDADFFYGERSEEHTSELQSLMRISYAVFCLKKKNTHTIE